MGEHQGPFFVAEVGRFGAVGMGHSRRLFDVGDQIAPGGGEALVRLRLGATFDQGFDHAGR